MIEEFEIGDLVQDATREREISHGFVYDVPFNKYRDVTKSHMPCSHTNSNSVYVFWFSGPCKYDMRCREWAEDLVLVSKGVTR
jgi:hypothetical protein